jgi:hypothetical protein
MTHIARANALAEAVTTKGGSVAGDIPIPKHHELWKFVAKLLQAHITLLRQNAVFHAKRNQTSKLPATANGPRTICRFLCRFYVFQ